MDNMMKAVSLIRKFNKKCYDYEFEFYSLNIGDSAIQTLPHACCTVPYNTLGCSRVPAVLRRNYWYSSYRTVLASSRM